MTTKNTIHPNSGLCLIHRHTYGGNYEWFAYPCYKATENDFSNRDDVAAEAPRPYSAHRCEEQHLGDFGISISTSEAGNYYYHPGFAVYRIDDANHARRIAATLDKFNRNLRRIQSEDGFPATPGHYLVQVCKALGLKFVVVKRDKPAPWPWSGSEYYWEKPGEVVYRVNALLEGKGK